MCPAACRKMERNLFQVFSFEHEFSLVLGSRSLNRGCYQCRRPTSSLTVECVSLIKLYWAEVINLELKAQACDTLAHLNSTFSLLNIKSFQGRIWIQLIRGWFLRLVSLVGLCWVNHPHGSSQKRPLCWFVLACDVFLISVVCTGHHFHCLPQRPWLQRLE